MCGGGRWQEEDRNKNSHYFLSSLLPSLPELDSDAKERCQGASFSVLFLSGFLRPWLPSLAPHFVGLRLQKERGRVGGKAVGTEAQGEGGRHLRELAPVKWRRWQVWAESQPCLVDTEGGAIRRRTFWLMGNSAESSHGCNWEEKMGREGRRRVRMAAPWKGAGW